MCRGILGLDAVHVALTVESQLNAGPLSVLVVAAVGPGVGKDLAPLAVVHEVDRPGAVISTLGTEDAGVLVAVEGEGQRVDAALLGRPAQVGGIAAACGQFVAAPLFVRAYLIFKCLHFLDLEVINSQRVDIAFALGQHQVVVP